MSPPRRAVLLLLGMLSAACTKEHWIAGLDYPDGIGWIGVRVINAGGATSGFSYELRSDRGLRQGLATGDVVVWKSYNVMPAYVMWGDDRTLEVWVPTGEVSDYYPTIETATVDGFEIRTCRLERPFRSALDQCVPVTTKPISE